MRSQRAAHGAPLLPRHLRRRTRRDFLCNPPSCVHLPLVQRAGRTGSGGATDSEGPTFVCSTTSSATEGFRSIMFSMIARMLYTAEASSEDACRGHGQERGRQLRDALARMLHTAEASSEKMPGTATVEAYLLWAWVCAVAHARTYAQIHARVARAHAARTTQSTHLLVESRQPVHQQLQGVRLQQRIHQHLRLLLLQQSVGNASKCGTQRRDEDAEQACMEGRQAGRGTAEG